jgi:hypothetical protein
MHKLRSSSSGHARLLELQGMRHKFPNDTCPRRIGGRASAIKCSNEARPVVDHISRVPERSDPAALGAKAPFSASVGSWRTARRVRPEFRWRKASHRPKADGAARVRYVVQGLSGLISHKHGRPAFAALRPCRTICWPGKRATRARHASPHPRCRMRVATTSPTERSASPGLARRATRRCCLPARRLLQQLKEAVRQRRQRSALARQCADGA